MFLFINSIAITASVVLILQNISNKYDSYNIAMITIGSICTIALIVFHLSLGYSISVRGKYSLNNSNKLTNVI